VDLTATLDVDAPPEELFAWVEDLGRYPAWLEIVPRAEALPDADAWSVDLRGAVGPLARSKRLRMERRVHEPPRRVVFERAEIDGRRHSDWVLTAEVEPLDPGARLRMHLHYGGRLFAQPLELLLRQEIERSRTRLAALLTTA
jgi:hypothetical protein